MACLNSTNYTRIYGLFNNEIIKVNEFKEKDEDNEDNRDTIEISDEPRIIKGKMNSCGWFFYLNIL